MEKLKNLASYLLASLFFFSFVIPAVPAAGGWAYNQLTDNKPASSSFSDVQDKKDLPRTLGDSDYEYEEKDASDYEYEKNDEPEYGYEDEEYESDYGSNDSDENGYVNTYGNYVPSPSYTNYGNPSARCRDGTYSYSQSRQGTCSYHGGVDYWY